MKVALYIRVSREDLNTDNQRLALEEYCQNRGLEIYKTYTDIASGSKDSRPALDRLMKDSFQKNLRLW